MALELGEGTIVMEGRQDSIATGLSVPIIVPHLKNMGRFSLVTTFPLNNFYSILSSFISFASALVIMSIASLNSSFLLLCRYSGLIYFSAL